MISYEINVVINWIKKSPRRLCFFSRTRNCTKLYICRVMNIYRESETRIHVVLFQKNGKERDRQENENERIFFKVYKIGNSRKRKTDCTKRIKDRSFVGSIGQKAILKMIDMVGSGLFAGRVWQYRLGSDRRINSASSSAMRHLRQRSRKDSASRLMRLASVFHIADGTLAESNYWPTHHLRARNTWPRAPIQSCHNPNASQAMNTRCDPA